MSCTCRWAPVEACDDHHAEPIEHRPDPTTWTLVVKADAALTMLATCLCGACYFTTTLYLNDDNCIRTDDRGNTIR